MKHLCRNSTTKRLKAQKTISSTNHKERRKKRKEQRIREEGEEKGKRTERILSNQLRMLRWREREKERDRERERYRERERVRARERGREREEERERGTVGRHSSHGDRNRGFCPGVPPSNNVSLLTAG